jgi:hypothetical protein
MPRRRILGAVSLVLFCVPASALGAAPPDSGVVGVVRAAGCVERPCRPSPLPALVRVLRRDDGTVVATAKIRDLRFRVALRPGVYVLRLVRNKDTAGAGGRVVVVRPHAFTLVVLRA